MVRFSAMTTLSRSSRALALRRMIPTAPGSRDIADLGGAEDRANLGAAQFLLLVDRFEHALEGLLDIVDRLVDHRVVADLNAPRGWPARWLCLGTDVEADDDGVRGRGRLTLVSVMPPTPRSMTRSSTSSSTWMPSRPPRAPRPYRRCRPEDQVELAGLLERRLQILQADPLAGTGRHGVALAGAAPVGDLAGDAILVDDEELSPAPGTEVKPMTCTGRDGTPLRRPRRARRPCGARGRRRRRPPRSRHPQRAALDQHGRHRPPATVEVRLDGHARASMSGWPAGPTRRRR